MSWQQGITLAVAVTSALVGLSGVAIAYFAYKRELHRDSVRIRIRVMNAIVQNGSGFEDYLAIEVVNLSTFPVTISQVGLSSDDWTMLPPPSCWKTPCRLEPRDGTTVHYPLSAVSDKKKMSGAKCAFARTQCGELFESPPVSSKMAAFLAGRAQA